MKTIMWSFLVAVGIIGWFALWGMAIDWSLHHQGFYAFAPMIAWLLVSLTVFLSLIGQPVSKKGKP